MRVSQIIFYSHFSCHKDRRRTVLVRSIHLNPHYVPWQQHHIPTSAGLAILHPRIGETIFQKKKVKQREINTSEEIIRP